MRKEEYRIKTVLTNEYAYKYNDTNKSVKHLNNIKENIDILNNIKINILDSYDDEKIISKYIKQDNLESQIISLLNTDKEKAIEILNKFKKELEHKLGKTSQINNVFEKYEIQVESEIINKLNFVKHGFWDMILSNCFYIDGKFYFYDQEWKEENIPIEFIFYRSIKYMNLNNIISKEELLEIFDIKNEYIEIFDKLDDELQLKIRDPYIWKIHKQGNDIISILTKNHENNMLILENQQKDEKIKELTHELNTIKNSKTWKIIRKIRRIKD